MDVLVPETLRALGLADIDPAIPCLRLVDGRFADAVLAANIGNRNPASNSLRMPMI
jgi:hypothetical protein